MLPTKEKAEEILKEAEQCNPGPWGNHSRTAAHCAGKVAPYCEDMDTIPSRSGTATWLFESISSKRWGWICM